LQLAPDVRDLRPSLSAISLQYPAAPQIHTLSLHDALPICNDNVTDSLRIPNFHCPYSTESVIVIKTTKNKIGYGEKNNVIAVKRSEEHTSELQSRFDLVCRLLLEKKNIETASEMHDRLRIA